MGRFGRLHFKVLKQIPGCVTSDELEHLLFDLVAVESYSERKGEVASLGVTDKSFVESMKLLALRGGILAEAATAASVSAVRLMIKKAKVRSYVSVLCVITGRGLKDIGGRVQSAARGL